MNASKFEYSMKIIVISLFIALSSCAVNQTKNLPLPYDLFRDRGQSIPSIEEIDRCYGAFISPYTVNIECGGRMIDIVHFENTITHDFDSILKSVLNMSMNRQYKILEHTNTKYYVKFPATKSVFATWVYIHNVGRDKYIGYTCSEFNKHDLNTCDKLIKYISQNGISAIKMHDNEISSVSIGNKLIKTGPRCRYLGGRNYQCPGEGQISWSIHKTFQEAKNVQDEFKRSTLAKPGTNLVKSENKVCTIDGSQYDCEILVIKITSAAHWMYGLQPDEKNTLKIIYSTAKTDRGYLQSICSFYLDQATENGLAQLCSDYLSIDSI